MQKKVKKQIVALLMAVMVIGASVPVQATTASITGTIVKKKIYGKYCYGSYGSRLQIILKFRERHSTTGDVYKDSVSATVVGNYNSVEKLRAADEGYNYTRLAVYGYADGSLKAKITGIEP